MPTSFCFGYSVNFSSLLTAAYAWPTVKAMRGIRLAKWNNKLVSSSDKTGIAHLPAEILEFINSYLLEVVFEEAENRWPLKEACICNWLEALGDVMPVELEDLYNDFMTEQLLAAENKLRDQQAVLDIDALHTRDAVRAAKAAVAKDSTDTNTAALVRLEQTLKSLEATWYVIESDCELEFNHDFKMDQPYFRRMNIEFRQSAAFHHYKATVSATRFATCSTCPADRFIAFETLCHGSSGRPLGTPYNLNKDVAAIELFLNDHDLCTLTGSEGEGYDKFMNREVDHLYTTIGHISSGQDPGRTDRSCTFLLDPALFSGFSYEQISNEMILLAKNFRLAGHDYEELTICCVDESVEGHYRKSDAMDAHYVDMKPQWMVVTRRMLDRNSEEYTGDKPVPAAVSDDEESQ